MFEFFGRKKAVIIETNVATGDVQTSDPIPSIRQANHASSAYIAANGGVEIAKEVNEYEGNETTFILPTQQTGVWHEHQHIVLPEDLPA